MGKDKPPFLISLVGVFERTLETHIAVNDMVNGLSISWRWGMALEKAGEETHPRQSIPNSRRHATHVIACNSVLEYPATSAAIW